MLWAPARGPLQASAGPESSQTSASSAFASYSLQFQELTKIRAHTTALSLPLLMASWTAFNSRWLAAATAAAKVGKH